MIIENLQGRGFELVLIQDIIYKDNYEMDHAGMQISNAPALDIKTDGEILNSEEDESVKTDGEIENVPSEPEEG